MSKERPILFSGPMIRAILEGRKTQTRRIVKFIKYPSHTLLTGPSWAQPGETIWLDPADPLGAACSRFCPYGVPGDRLWVREKFGAFKESSKECSSSEARYVVLEDGTQVYRDGSIYPGLSSYNEGAFWFKWRPSIHMPRWAARITLEVTCVRVERLQSIQLYECAAEGARPTGDCDEGDVWDSTRTFEELWESINGEGSWDANPWVWVLEFKRIAQAVSA